MCVRADICELLCVGPPASADPPCTKVHRETARFFYKCDNYYAPEVDSGVAFNDPELGIDWKLEADQLLLSDKDTKQPAFAEATYFDYNQNLYDL